MIPYIIKGGLHAYAFLLNLFTMAGPNQDIFTTLLSPKLRNDIASFIASHYQFALSTNQAFFALQSRFLVTNIGINKAGMPAQHESFALWVFDRVTFARHEFVIECVPSDHSYASRFSAFSQCPDSQSVLDSIQKAIHNIQSMTAQAAESLSAAIKTETETIPLLPLTNDPSPNSSTSSPTSSTSTLQETETTPLLPTTNDPSSNLSTSLPTLSTNTPYKSLVDIVTSSLVRAVAVARAGSQSISPQSLAEDTITGYPLGTLVLGDCIRQFKPEGLSLFDAVLLALVVHEYAPIYGLFDNHCYLFASVMFDTIIQLYSLPISAFDLNPNHASNPNAGPVPAPTPEVGAPNNANIIVVPAPDQAGCWSGLLVLDPTVKAAVVSVVISQFKVQHASYMASVIP